MRSETIHKLKQVLDLSVEKGEIAGASFCVEEQGKKVCYIESGYANIEEGKPIRRDNIFRLFSMSKPMTAAVAMALMEKGILDLAEPVSTYLPAFRGQTVITPEGKEVPALREVMVKDLLNMTSGLMYPGAGEPGRKTDEIFEELDRRLFTDHPMTTLELAERLGKAPLAFHPGRSWLYGSSADVLGAVMEQATGMSFGQLMKEYLFEPLDMQDTDFYVPEEKRDRLAVAYEVTDQGLQPYRGNFLGMINTMDRKPAFESGGAGLVSTVDDCMKFARMLLQEGTYQGRKVLKPATVHFLTEGELLFPQQRAWEMDYFTLAGYSYGNYMRVRKTNASAWYLGSVGEYGWDGWLGCYFSNDPLMKRSIVFMTQCRDAATLPVLRKLRNIVYAESE